MPLSNTQYNSIMRKYEARRLDSERTLREHFDIVRAKLPEYSSLEEQEASYFVQKAEARMDGDAERVRALSEELALIKAKKEGLLSRSGFDADYLQPHYICSDCKDTGYISPTEKCHCFKNESVSLLYEQSGIRDLLSTDNFDSLSYEYYEGEDLSRFQNAVTTCRNFINNFNSDYHNLFFYGTVGVGKSFLSGCVAKELIEKGNLVIYFSAINLFSEISKNTFDYKSREDLSSLQDDLYNCDLLIIDDLGTELTNTFVASQLFSTLNERHLRKKATIISTNLSFSELRDRYSDRIFSRITSNYEICKLTGQDIRMYKKRQISRK